MAEAITAVENGINHHSSHIIFKQLGLVGDSPTLHVLVYLLLYAIFLIKKLC